MSEETENNLLTMPRYKSKDAAKLLGVSGTALYHSRSNGLLFGVAAPRYTRMGRIAFYFEKDLLAWLAGFQSYSSLSDEREAAGETVHNSRKYLRKD